MTNHPGITERRDSSGRVRYRVRIRRNGAEFTATLATLAEALAWRSQALDAADGHGIPPEAQRRPQAGAAAPAAIVTVEYAARRLVRGMVDGTIRTRRGETFKPSVVRTYEIALRLDVLPKVATVPVASIRRGDVQRLVDAIAAERSEAHARKALIALRVALRVAERYGEIDRNPCDGVRVPLSQAEPRAPHVLGADDCALLIRAADRDDAERGRSLAGPLVQLLLGTGLRLGEVLALPWGADGLDLDAGFVRVRRSLDREKHRTDGYRLVAPKSRRSRRDVPLPPSLVTSLRRHRLATGRPTDGAFVFSDAIGGPLAAHGIVRSTWMRVATAALGRCGVCSARACDWREDDDCAHELAPLPRLHDLRHTFASHALDRGLSAQAVAKLLGHSDAGLVWERYGHALPEEMARAGDAVEGWFAGIAGASAGR